MLLNQASCVADRLHYGVADSPIAWLIAFTMHDNGEESDDDEHNDDEHKTISTPRTTLASEVTAQALV